MPKYKTPERKTPERMAYHLSFRPGDPYEVRLHDALERMPRGYAKDAIVNMMREFIPRTMKTSDIHQLLMDFARDVRAQRVVSSPEVAAAAPVIEPRQRVPSAPARAAAAPKRGGSQLVFEVGR